MNVENLNRIMELGERRNSVLRGISKCEENLKNLGKCKFVKEFNELDINYEHCYEKYNEEIKKYEGSLMVGYYDRRDNKERDIRKELADLYIGWVIEGVENLLMDYKNELIEIDKELNKL